MVASVLNRETYVPIVLRAIWEELPRVLGGGFLLSVCCVPAFLLFGVGFVAGFVLISIVTVAPAWAALLAIQLPLLSEESVLRFNFVQALRTYGRRASQLSLAMAVPVAAMLVTLPALQQPHVPLTIWLILGLEFFGIAWGGAVLLYAFPLLVYADGGVSATLRTSWILVGRHPFNALGLMGLAILLGFAITYVSLGLLFLLPAFYGMFVMGNCLLVLAIDREPKDI